MSGNRAIQCGLIFGILGIILGAFGAHSLKDAISADSLNSFQTGIRYQMYHAFLLILIGFFRNRFKEGYFRLATLACIIGTIFFSGSIYFLTTREITQFSVSFLGPITPVGGLLLITSWILLLLGLKRAIGSSN